MVRPRVLRETENSAGKRLHDLTTIGLIEEAKGFSEFGTSDSSEISASMSVQLILPYRSAGLETSAFDFGLPGDLIAQKPVEPRDRSRLMIVWKDKGTIEHSVFAELPNLLDFGDIVIRNDSKVVPARLVGHRSSTGGYWEGLFLRALPDSSCWEILATTRGKPLAGETVVVRREPDDDETLVITLLSKEPGGRWIVRPESLEPGFPLLERFGRVPLPPYIRKGVEESGDRVNYQTVYAHVPGSVAAPTAGLHFTEGVFNGLAKKQVTCHDVTLHVGLGTFRPIEAEQIEDHVLHGEWAELSQTTAEAINRARTEGRRVVAVGTTSARVLETAALSSGDRVREVAPFRGETATYLLPGHDFQGFDALVTNFHLPKSSLLVLVSAFGGFDLIRAAYAEAVARRYRFYSYGDAMLVL